MYKRKDLLERAKKAATDNNLFFVNDVVAFLPCTQSTFYTLIKSDSKEMDELRAVLEVNKIKTKSSIRAKLYQSTKAGELLALYRLICTDDERRMLNQQYVELHGGKDGEAVKFEVNIVGGKGDD